MISILGGLTEYQYNPESKSFNLSMKNLHATVAALLQVRAKSGDQEVVLYKSSMMNSIYGNIPIRYSYEPETDKNVLMEDDRLNSQIEALKPVSLRPHVDTELKCIIIPSFLMVNRKKINTETFLMDCCLF